jgi:putative endonuclease
MATNRRKRAYYKGLLAEWLALTLLLLKGYRPCAWRYKTPVGEIDLIMRTRHSLVFVEVKARQHRADALAAITPRNQQRVARAAQYYLYAHPEYAPLTLRLDVVCVPWYGWPYHTRNAFHYTSV